MAIFKVDEITTRQRAQQADRLSREIGDEMASQNLRRLAMELHEQADREEVQELGARVLRENIRSGEI